MSSIIDSIYNMRHLDDMARKETFVHRIHPLAKLLTTLVYLIAVISFDKYDISGLMPFLAYPVFIFTFAEIPPNPVLKKILLIEPIVIMIGIFNPIFDTEIIELGGFTFSSGWISFFSIIIKSSLTIIAALLLIATTGMDKLAAALRMLKVPKILVLQLLLTYRYISVLTEEVSRMMRAYSIRAPGQKGVQRKAWGSFAGQLILRTFDRAQRVYQAMILRGFNGEYNTGKNTKLKGSDITYIATWVLFFIIAKIYNIPVIIGNLF